MRGRGVVLSEVLLQSFFFVSWNTDGRQSRVLEPMRMANRKIEAEQEVLQSQKTKEYMYFLESKRKKGGR